MKLQSSALHGYRNGTPVTKGGGNLPGMSAQHGTTGVRTPNSGTSSVTDSVSKTGHASILNSKSGHKGWQNVKEPKPTTKDINDEMDDKTFAEFFNFKPVAKRAELNSALNLEKYNVFATLNDGQKKKVRSWIKEKYNTVTKPISDHVFGNKTRLTLPDKIDYTESPPKPDERVRRFLYQDHHWRPDDYKKGIVYHDRDRNRKRPLKIGRVLEKLKAPDEIKKAYMNDPARAGAKKKDLRITISRHPYDVAGMSTGKGWSSCMNMEDGDYSRLLKDDIAHGTHVAYLHEASDHEVRHPLARIALKPFEHKGEKTILRPENSVYGTGPEEFGHKVKKWAEDNFKPKDNRIYKKNEHVYDDSGNASVLNHNNNRELFRHNSLDSINEVKASGSGALKDIPITHDDIRHQEGNVLVSRHFSLLQHINENADIPTKIALSKSPNSSFASHFAKNPAEKLGERKLTKVLAQHPDPNVRYTVAHTPEYQRHYKTNKILSKDSNPEIANQAKENLRNYSDYKDHSDDRED